MTTTATSGWPTGATTASRSSAPDGQFLMKFGSTGDGDGQLNRPTKVAVDKEGIIYVADFKNDRLQVFDAEGNFMTKLLGEATLSTWGRERVNLDPSSTWTPPFPSWTGPGNGTSTTCTSDRKAVPRPKEGNPMVGAGP